MVRLKVETKKAILLIGSAFQFLMVRLKVSLPLLLSSVKTISIPYGAIKSGGMLRWEGKVYPISIPYGAIKRETNFAKIY